MLKLIVGALFAMTSPQVITQSTDYQQSVTQAAGKKMVNLKNISADFHYDLVYASSENFTGQQLYPYPAAFMRQDAALALKKVALDLKSKGLGLKIWDSYRPYSVSQKMYQFIQDDRYVAHPQLGSKHNRGCAIDLTLIDLNTQQELEMPTAYTDFSEKAWHSTLPASKAALTNRTTLKNAMQAHGFEAYNEEWWHYNYGLWQNYELLDLSFGELARLEAG